MSTVVLNNQKIGNKIYSLRSEKHLSAKEFSKAVSIPKDRLDRIEKGEATLNLRDALKISNYFDVALDDIVFFELH